jgi:branched-chain amino acid transport system substrate-binding protein
MRLGIGFVGAMLMAAGIAQPAWCQISNDVVKIGVLNDQSGLYADTSGRGSVEAVKMAVADFGGTVNGKPIVVIDADHQNKPDIASTIARRWFDQENVDVVVDLTGSAVALAVSELAKQMNKAAIVSSAGATTIVGSACTPNTVLWSFNNRALAVGLTKTLVEQGGKNWFFVTVDYAFGHSLEAETTSILEGLGGKVVGHVRHPLNTMDFSSALLQAQASKADVIALANTGGDTVNAIKQAQEFGVGRGGQKVVTLLLQSADIRSLGLQSAQGLMTTTGFEWSLDDDKKAWSRRFFDKTGRMPTMVQAGLYSGVLHYLKAVRASNVDSTSAVIDAMKKMPVNDMFAENGHVRADGMHVHDMYVVRIKAPSESKEPWDFYDLVATVPGDQAYGSLESSDCPLVRK